MINRAEDDKDMEVLIGMILRVGVSLAAAIVAIGGVVFLFGHGLAPARYQSFQTSPGVDLSTVLQRVGRLDGAAIIELGILVLIATPVTRVVLMVYAFLKERDVLYAVFSSIVLTVLAYSMLS